MLSFEIHGVSLRCHSVSQWWQMMAKWNLWRKQLGSTACGISGRISCRPTDNSSGVVAEICSQSSRATQSAIHMFTWYMYPIKNHRAPQSVLLKTFYAELSGVLRIYVYISPNPVLSVCAWLFSRLLIGPICVSDIKLLWSRDGGLWCAIASCI